MRSDDEYKGGANTYKHNSYWQQVILNILTALLAVFTLGAFATAGIYACIANRQLNKMNDTYKEIQRQTYLSCINTQAAQKTLIQVQNGAVDSHGAAVSAIQQVAAQIEAERARLWFDARPPEQGKFLVKDPNDPVSIARFGVPYVVKNIGKTTAVKYDVHFAAILLQHRSTDKFVIRYSPEQRIKQRMYGSIAAGEQFPQKEEGGLRPLTYFIPVQDINGNPIPYPSEAAQSYYDTQSEIMVFGEMTYRDYWGRYKLSFCAPFLLVNVGSTTGKTTQQEITCAKYNQAESEYLNRPEIKPLPKPPTVSPIECPVPPE